MPKVIFRFDTEDYVNLQAADGVLNAIKPLNEAGIKGTFVVVAKFAEELKRLGRTDIIDALKEHDIGTHSYGHSLHPTLNEYTDLKNYDEALRIFNETESMGNEILKDVFGIDEIKTYCGPGASISYISLYGYYDMGTKISAGGGAYYGDIVRERPSKYCNITSLITSHNIDEMYNWPDGFVDELIENIAEKNEVCVFCHHPARNLVLEYYDELNFKGVNTSPENYILSTPLTSEQKAKWMENYKYLIKKIVEDERFEVIEGKDIEKLYFTEERTINIDTLKEVKPQLDEEWFPVTIPHSYCLSDIMLACCDLLLGKKEHQCGKVYGFLDTPFEISAPLTLTKTDLIEAANQIGDRFLPEKFNINNKEFGPADFTRAALDMLVNNKESATIFPASFQIDLNEFPKLKTLNFKGGWVHSDDFEDNFVSHRMRLQSWTIRLPKNSKRKIF